MSGDLRGWKQRLGRVVMSLMVLLALGSNAFAAQAPSFSATTSGPISNLTVTASLHVADADIGKTGAVYLGFIFNDIAHFNNGAAWVPYVGGALPIYAAGTLGNASAVVVRNENLSALVGGMLYLGYGLTENDMLTHGKFALVYTVAADTAALAVSQTNIANGATGVPTHTIISATLNKAIDPLSLTTATMTLACPAGTPITGTLSHAVASNVATFAPAAPLPFNTTCTATLTTGLKDVGGNALASPYTWRFTTSASQPMGPALVSLGTAGNYAVLAKAAVSTVPPSVITGDIGVSPAATSYLTGFSLTMVGTASATSPQVIGNLHGADMTTPTSANLTTAVLDMQAAYSDAAGRSTPDFLNLNSGNIGGLTLAPGLYNWGSSVVMPADAALSGGPDDVWIFQMSGDLNVSASKRVTLAGGAQAKNVFWQVAGQVRIGGGAHFEGNILSQTAIALLTGATMNGRALAQTQVELQSATITKPAP